MATATTRRKPDDRDGSDIHPSWKAFMDLCANLGHGEIERLKIQDGLPVFAEKIVEKFKLT